MIEGVGKVATSAIDALRGNPLAIALLAVNCLFLGVAIYVLGEVAANAKERNAAQLDLIGKLVASCVHDFPSKP